ncbi:MAG TPA: D-alanine--D-alanine ligase family protein [Methylomirabilota bacterium]|jgi:D-alanine-D-alanine ligase|nr:D-alanine--D-alanine ligase family protein [Methylomirabilota bacterium]
MQVPLNGHSRKLRVGVLFGGRSGEHEVSLASAASIIRGLDPQKYEAVPIGITKEGHWLIGAGAQKMLPEVLRTGQRVLMSADPTESALMPLDGSPRGQKLDVVFPVIHGTFGEDGTMQGLLELAGLPFVGAGVLGSAIGMDKDVAKKLMQVAGIPVVPWIAVQRADWERQPKEIRRAIEKKFKYPVFVKPATLGSSVGMTKVHSRAELGPALDLAAEFAMKIMVERAVSAREIEVSVLGNHDPRASLPGEIVPHREFYDYAAKYLEEGTKLLIPAKLKKSEVKKVQGMAVTAFRALELSGMARVDFFIEKRGGKIFLNEVNTIPGFTSISMYPKLWEANGIPFRELIGKLIDLALEQHREKARTKYQIELPEGASGALGG